MRLCMFHPLDHPMERGWVGRIDGDRVVHLAAQTLQSFFTGGGSAREHAVYALESVRLLAPVLHPPAVRIFEDESTFAFANPASIAGPGSEIGHRHEGSDDLAGDVLELRPRVAAVVGGEGLLAGFAVCAEWRDPARTPPKDRDFALGLGPYVATADELDPRTLDGVVRVDGAEELVAGLPAFDWEAARRLAADGTTLYPGDLVVSPPAGVVERIEPGAEVEVEVPGLGTLRQSVLPEFVES
jgi:hypothetical protein